MQKAFDDFYANNVIYDLTRQWITQPGPFIYDYRWLTQKGSDEDVQAFAERSFESVYDAKPSHVFIL